MPPTKVKKIAVIGAGFMGASVGYVSARAGLDVVLIDRDQESADKGKGARQKRDRRADRQGPRQGGRARRHRRRRADRRPDPGGEDWIKGGGKTTRRGTKNGFSGQADKSVFQGRHAEFPAANAIYRRETYDNYPATRAILRLCL